MDELTFKEFRKFVISMPAIKMHVFVSFLFDKESLLSIKDEWCKHYEENFVQVLNKNKNRREKKNNTNFFEKESFVNQLLKWHEESQDLEVKLKQLVSGTIIYFL